MLKLSDLDGFKLVNDEYLATNDQVTRALENAFEQGSQGWGVRPEVAIFLSLVSQLRVQITLADVARYAQNQLKGEQMAHGRTKKRRDKDLGDLNIELLQTKAALDAARAVKGPLCEQTVVLDK
ncbi:hypothetical protein LCGC14_1438310 [marine sediment metagenome]|uniref:Uncharacterized protein n=1 Tax=marine sediment metagenome TaxID=412755 RepID=A0A0F9JM02_9ZZZZ